MLTHSETFYVEFKPKQACSLDFDSHLELSILAPILDCFCNYFSTDEFIGLLNLLFDLLHDFPAVLQDEILSFT